MPLGYTRNGRKERRTIARMISTEDTAGERALLVGTPSRHLPAALAEEHLNELARLADTAGAETVGCFSQRLEAPNPKYFIGEGKAKELKDEVVAARATVVLFDDELSPAQGKNLEDLLQVRVLDRAELILDIFAKRARTREAQMQVELAQLEYMLPRLKRMWTHLSRIRGGIGLRGPGETQLETDRRMISRRIRDLRRKLEGVARRRTTQRRGRSGEFRVGLVGYTNAGKSSLLRALSGAELLVEDRLFATLDATTRLVDLGDGLSALVTDTVGFIRKLPHDLVASFRATMEEASEADLLLNVIDASHPGLEEQMEVVAGVLMELDVSAPVIPVFNKIDRLTHAEERALRDHVSHNHPGPSAFSSTREPGGTEEIKQLLREQLLERRTEVHLVLPVVDGAALAAVYREGEVLHREDNGTTIDLVARLPAPVVGKLERRGGVRISNRT